MKKWMLIFFCQVLLGMETDFFFYLEEAKEGSALLPVLERLEGMGKGYVVLVGEGAKGCLQGRIPLSRLYTFAELGLKGDAVRAQDAHLPEQEIRKLVRTVRPKLVLTGVSCRVQGQVLEAYRCVQVPTIAYWNALSAEGDRVAHEVVRKGLRAFFAINEVALDIRFADLPPLGHLVVGQPAFDAWKALGTRPHEGKTLVYLGGTGKEYEEGFDLFLKALEHKSCSSFQITVRPQGTGMFEKKRLEALKFYLPKIALMQEGSLQEAIGQADVVVCHQAEEGLLASCAGKRVIYLVPETQVFHSVLLEKELAQMTSTTEHFRKALFHPPKQSSCFEAMQLPESSTEVFLNALFYAAQEGVEQGR